MSLFRSGSGTSAVMAMAVAVTMGVISPAGAQTAPRPQVHNVVLVHGAWADGSSWAGVIARLQARLFDWALHPKMHITTPNARIANYADKQMQVKGGILIGIWDEAELTAIRQQIETRSS